MTKQDAYRIVLNDILNQDIGMFTGKFDAKNGNKNFINGIGTVMEFIAYTVSEVDGESFSDLFMKNYIKSLKRLDK